MYGCRNVEKKRINKKKLVFKIVNIDIGAMTHVKKEHENAYVTVLHKDTLPV